MARAGRKRRINVKRDETGKCQEREKFDPNIIYFQPHRRDLKTPDATEAGYPLGRLQLNRLVTSDQLKAGNAYASVVYAFARMNGISMGSPRSGSMSECIATGFYAWETDKIDNDPEAAKKRIEDIKYRYNECHETLAKLGRMHNRGNQILHVMRDICIQEVEERGIWADPHKLGDLRLGLNAVHRVLFEKK